MFINKKIIIFGYLSILISCSSVEKKLIPTYNKGGYQVNILKTNLNDTSIEGKIFNFANGKPISHSEVIIGCLKYKTSSNGEYSFKLNNLSDTFFIKASSIGYKTVETNFINLNKKGKMRIDFYLIEDDRPLINCEGKN
jgi:hypothetical protein